MSYKFIAPAFLVALLLQMSVLGSFSLMGVSVNIMLCLTVVLCFVYSDNYPAVICAICTGIIYDICLSQYLGTFTMALLLTCVACIILRRFLNPEHVFTMVIITVIGNLVFYHGYWLILLILGHAYNYYMVAVNLPVYIIMNGIIAMILYAVVIRKAVSHRQDRYFG